MSNELSLNLRTLCSYYNSIADVCRKIDINRQQFNKYLGGKSLPSLKNLRRINDFFGLEEDEIFLPHEKFVELVSARDSSKSKFAFGPLQIFLENISVKSTESQEIKESYCGFYYEYYCSPSNPGLISKSLLSIYLKNGQIFSRLIERIPYDERGRVRHYHKNYDGLVFSIQNQILLIDADYHLGNNFGMRIISPPNRSRASLLTGLGLAITGGRDSQPYSYQAVWEFIDKGVSIKGALKKCSLYPYDSSEIENDIKERLFSNSVDEGAFMLTNCLCK